MQHLAAAAAGVQREVGAAQFEAAVGRHGIGRIVVAIGEIGRNIDHGRPLGVVFGSREVGGAQALEGLGVGCGIGVFGERRVRCRGDVDRVHLLVVGDRDAEEQRLMIAEELRDQRIGRPEIGGERAVLERHHLHLRPHEIVAGGTVVEREPDLLGLLQRRPVGVGDVAVDRHQRRPGMCGLGRGQGNQDGAQQDASTGREVERHRITSCRPRPTPPAWLGDETSPAGAGPPMTTWPR